MVKKTPSEEYEVEQILERRVEAGRVLYRVKWTGYSEEESTWEPVGNLGGCQDLLDAFEKHRPKSKVAMKIPRTPSLPPKQQLEPEDWNLLNESRPKSPPKRCPKKSQPGVLGVDKVSSIVRRWRVEGEWRFEVQWESKAGQTLLNSEVTVQEMKMNEMDVLIDYLVREAIR